MYSWLQMESYAKYLILASSESSLLIPAITTKLAEQNALFDGWHPRAWKKINFLPHLMFGVMAL